MGASEAPFEPLATWLERRAAGARPEPAPAKVEPLAPEPAPLPETTELLREVRRFRARLADALETARGELLRELACAVVGRELLLGAADVARLAGRLAAEHAVASPLRLRVAAADADRVPADVAPVVVDPALEPGDLVLEFADARVDARLGVRLAAVLEACS